MSGGVRSRGTPLAAAALARGASVTTAAKDARVTERTVYRWLKDPAFCREVDRLRAQLWQETAALLAGAGRAAAVTLVALLRPDMPPATRLGAARALLEIGERLRFVTDGEQRIAELEASLEFLRHQLEQLQVKVREQALEREREQGRGNAGLRARA